MFLTLLLTAVWGKRAKKSARQAYTARSATARRIETSLGVGIGIDIAIERELISILR